VSQTTSRLHSIFPRLALFGGGAVVAFAYFEELIRPFIPLIFTIIGSLILGFIVRHIFVVLLNKRLAASYRHYK
jgi:hypothetical protein